jgi:uncharacterized protein (DUF1697 family)
MEIYISILRGINVSGQNRIKMDALKKMYEDLGFENVQTYIQSGNVIFQSDKSGQKDLEHIITGQIKIKFGYDILVIVLEINELKNIIARNLFVADQTKDISNIYVTFLSSKPVTVDFEQIYRKKSPNEEIALAEKVVYLYCPNGYGKTKLSNSYFEGKLNIAATTRNWKTTTELFSIAQKLQLRD